MSLLLENIIACRLFFFFFKSLTLHFISSVSMGWQTHWDLSIYLFATKSSTYCFKTHYYTIFFKPIFALPSDHGFVFIQFLFCKMTSEVRCLESRARERSSFPEKKKKSISICKQFYPTARIFKNAWTIYPLYDCLLLYVHVSYMYKLMYNIVTVPLKMGRGRCIHQYAVSVQT